eukprot:SAG11_NODE_9425_length_913_cov_0.952088_2_plen_135_part_00
MSSQARMRNRRQLIAELKRRGFNVESIAKPRKTKQVDSMAPAQKKLKASGGEPLRSDEELEVTDGDGSDGCGGGAAAADAALAAEVIRSSAARRLEIGAAAEVALSGNPGGEDLDAGSRARALMAAGARARALP